MPTSIEDLDLSTRRSVEIVELRDNCVVVRYFYHLGKFWQAVIPLHGVESICGQAYNFSSLKKRKTKDGEMEVVYDRRGYPKYKFGFINHVQSRFRMAKGQSVQLFDLEQDLGDDLSKKKPAHEIDDFVYSIEATGGPGVLFDFRNGMSGSLICTHRFLSTQEMVFERVVVLGYYVRESPPLPLSDAERREILVRSIKRSDQAKLSEPYYLIRCCGTNNCTSNPFRIIDQSVKYKWLHKLGSLVYRLPISPRFYLRIRGLDSDKSYYHLARNDFADFLSDPATRVRKREVVRTEIRKRREVQRKERKAKR